MIDALAHLDDPRITGLADVMQRAAGAGVTDVVSGGVDPLAPTPTWGPAPLRIWRAVGLHPRAIGDVPAQMAALQRHLDAPDVCAMGEVGLDGREGMPPDALQEEVLLQQLDMVRSRRLPVILHCVHRLGRLVDLLEAHPLPAGGMVHGYAGPAELVPRLASLGLYISFGGLVGRPVARRCREAASQVPLDRLLVESDAPDHPLPGSPSEPAMVARLIDEIATLRHIPAAEVAQATVANARLLYKLPAGGNNLSEELQ